MANEEPTYEDNLIEVLDGIREELVTMNKNLEEIHSDLKDRDVI